MSSKDSAIEDVFLVTCILLEEPTCGVDRALAYKDIFKKKKYEQIFFFLGGSTSVV